MMFDFRDKNKKDPESEKIWERLKESESGWCCKMIRQIPLIVAGSRSCCLTAHHAAI